MYTWLIINFICICLGFSSQFIFICHAFMQKNREDWMLQNNIKRQEFPDCKETSFSNFLILLKTKLRKIIWKVDAYYEYKDRTQKGWFKINHSWWGPRHNYGLRFSKMPFQGKTYIYPSFSMKLCSVTVSVSLSILNFMGMYIIHPSYLTIF